MQEMDDGVDEDDDEFELPTACRPLLDEWPLFNENTAVGISLLHAPRPFNLRSGRFVPEY